MWTVSVGTAEPYTIICASGVTVRTACATSFSIPSRRRRRSGDRYPVGDGGGQGRRALTQPGGHPPGWSSEPYVRLSHSYGSSKGHSLSWIPLTRPAAAWGRVLRTDPPQPSDQQLDR